MLVRAEAATGGMPTPEGDGAVVGKAGDEAEGVSERVVPLRLAGPAGCGVGAGGGETIRPLCGVPAGKIVRFDTRIVRGGP